MCMIGDANVARNAILKFASSRDVMFVNQCHLMGNPIRYDF